MNVNDKVADYFTGLSQKNKDRLAKITGVALAIMAIAVLVASSK